MKQGRLNGASKVFTFTLVQNLKSAGIRFTTILFCLIVLASMPVMHLINNRGESESASIEKVYIKDDTGLGLSDFSAMSQKAKYSKVKFVQATNTPSLGENDLLLTISKKDASFILHYTVSKKSPMREDGFESYISEFKTAFEQVRVKQASVTKDQLNMINMPVTSDVVELKEDGTLPSEVNGLSNAQYYLYLGLVIACIMIVSISAETVASSIINEKGNKLVENLMISVDTNALVVGKVAGALMVVVIQVALMAACAVGSSVINMIIFNMDSLEVPSQIQAVFGAQGIMSFGIGKAVLCIVMLFLGVVFFALLAALFGAAISRVEDMAEGMKTFNLLMVLGAYAAIALSMAKMGGADVKGLAILACIIPITSMFAVPLEVFCGEITVMQGLGFAAILIVCIVLLVLFITRVYRVMILYKGERIKIRTMIGMAGKGGVKS